ncbi:oligosaccharide flippase family protein [Blautia wexlerae]|nr:oligosaccharide flippase family protein [Blautia wexlerae]
MSKKLFIKGTLLLTFAGLLSRLMGFFYRIFLSHTIGAHGLGIFQLILPLQILIMSICASGIQTAISRLTAAEKVSKNPSRHISDYFVVGTVFSVVFSLVFSWFLYSYADFWAVQILKESQTSSLIRILSLSIPLSTLHTCISSYYLGRKQAGFPAGVQLLEQLFRTGGCYILYLICASQGRNITPAIAVGGNLIGEIASSFISLFAVSMHFKVTHYNIRNIRRPLSVLRKLLHISVPLTMNKILLTLLGSIEVILIPARLANVRIYSQRFPECLRNLYRDGTSAYSFPRYAYKLGCDHADSLHYPAADSGVSKANPICDRQDFPILSAR